MDLILWRHGEADEAEAGMPDKDRPLTERGRKQAAFVAAWLQQQHLPKLTILSSPARRAQETAALVGRPVKLTRQLAVGHSCIEALSAAGWPDQNHPVLLVGHQPMLGRLAALLLSGSEADWSIKRGGLWWFSNRVRRDETQTILRAVINL